MTTYGVDMTQRIAAYKTACRTARRTYEAARLIAEAAEWKRLGEPSYYRDASRYDDEMRSAWRELSCGDPLVDWIVEHCADRRSAALEILAALPASLEDIDAVAYEMGLCSVYRRLRGEALKAVSKSYG